MSDTNKPTSMLDQIKSSLRPQGTEPLVRLFLNSSAYFQKEFVDECINDLEKAIINVNLGEPMTSLQKLAVHVLMDFAYIERKNN